MYLQFLSLNYNVILLAEKKNAICSPEHVPYTQFTKTPIHEESHHAIQEHKIITNYYQ